MALDFSLLAGKITHSEIRNMSIECEKNNGINLSQGVCDTQLPKELKEGVSEAINMGYNIYTRYDGIDVLRESIANKLLNYNKLNVNPENEIIVSAGATGAFFSTCLALLNKNDEVVVFEPYYSYHLSTIQSVGARCSFVQLNNKDWTIDESLLAKAINKNTKAILICTPSNPLGKVFSRDEINLIADYAIKYNLFIFTDEIYEYFLYDDKKHLSPGSIDRISDRTITISGFSKTFSITGWRIGYVAASRKWAKMIGYMNDLIYVCAPSPLQYAVAKGLNSIPKEYFISLTNEYKIKRDLIYSALEKANLEPIKPEGAYYILADTKNVPGLTSKEKSIFILNNTSVAGVPSEAFFQNNADVSMIRFCFAKPLSVLQDACDKLLNLKL